MDRKRGGNHCRSARLAGDAVRWAEATDDLRHRVLAASGALWTGGERRGGTLLDRTATAACARAALGMLGHALGLRAAGLLLAERFEDASLAAHEGLRLAREFGYENAMPPPLGVLAMLAAIHGHDDEARRAGGRGARNRDRPRARVLGRRRPVGRARFSISAARAGAGRSSA